MKKKNAVLVGELVRQFVRDEGLETPLNEFRLLSAWGEVMGLGIQKYTSNVFIKNQVLYVKLTSPILKNDLMMGRTNIIRRLNEHVGAQVISDIRFC